MQKGTVRPLKLKSGDTSWRVQYRDSAGKLVLETLGRQSQGWDRKRAGKELIARLDAVANKGWEKPKPVTFRDYIEIWYQRGQDLNKWDTATVGAYGTTKTRLVSEFGHLRLADVKRSHIAAYIAGLGAPGAKTPDEGYKPRTIHRIATVLHSVFKSALRDELIDRNPAALMELPKKTRYKSRVLSPEEALAVEERLTDPQVKFAFQTFKYLGIRWSELRQLRWRDLDFTNARLRIVDSKTEEGERVVAVTWNLLVGFQAHAERSLYTSPEDYIFCHPDSGNRWHPRQYRAPVKAAASSLGITDFRQAHDLRVTSITSGVLAGEHPDKLQARAGHRNYSTTQVYVELAGKPFHQEADALAAFFAGKPVEKVEESQQEG